MYQQFVLGGYLKGKPEPIAEGVSVRLDNSGLFALVTLEDPTKTEIQNMRKGNIQAKVFYQENSAFFLLKYGDLLWMDAPLKIETSTLPKMNGTTEGLAVTTLLADARDGKILVLRYTGLSPAFSKNICDLVAPVCHWDPSQSAKIQAAHNTLHMVNLAQFEN